MDPSSIPPIVQPAPTHLRSAEPYHLVTYPTTAINWVSKGKIGVVREQGECGACWVMAAVGTLEAYVAIKNNATPATYSIQQVLDCCTGYGCGGCVGGLH